MGNFVNSVIGIGGLGGSGTRVVAKLLYDTGLYFGDDLNEALDNLTFTRLFKNPEFIEKCTESELEYRLQIFTEYMSTSHLSLRHALELFIASFGNPTIHTNLNFLIDLLQKMHRKPAMRDRWCWKEPNTHVLLDIIAKKIKNFRYIHVIRHGLDMAYSSNTNQLRNWGHKFNLHISSEDSANEIAKKQLEYWILSNTRTLSTCEELELDYHIFNYSNLAKSPSQEVCMLLEFLGKKATTEEINNILKGVKLEKATPRYDSRGTDIFSDKQIKLVRGLGFEI